jgi:hypothetical protein
MPIAKIKAAHIKRHQVSEFESKYFYYRSVCVHKHTVLNPKTPGFMVGFMGE